uniref:Ig-like domain-containing protein n=1 Tax=Rhinolophus ferrumequinum TaxID=59479 RepID=A0A671FYE8_RHIFE
MEPPSAPARRGRVPWQGLLLAVSLLTFWSPLTTAQLALEFMPSNAAEWEDVLFLAHNLPEDLAGYAWFKGGRVDSKRQIASYKIDTGVNNPGPAYSGRETIYPNGSLLFQKVTLEDTGYYTLQAIKTNFHNEEVTGQLRTDSLDSAPTPCITSHDATYLWLINSQSVQNSTRLELSKDNRTLTLLNVTRNDTGPYECDIRNPVSASLNESSIPGKGRSGLSDGAIAGIVIGVLAGIALIAALVYFLCMIKSGGYGVSFLSPS